jgi:lipopolysaccharide/colanic/teichoic acid biosynthesis glycosyltransferase
MSYLEFFTSDQSRRHEVKPGITGYAQVNGRSNLNWDKKLKLDIYYVNNIGFWLDVRLIFKTFVNVILKKNTNPKNASFEIPFDEYVKAKTNG